MLGIFLFVGIGFWFSTLADKNNGNKTVWIIAGLSGWVVPQLFAGIVLGLFAPDMIDDLGSLTIISLLVSVVGVFIVKYYLEKNASNSKKGSSNDDDNDILDDFIE